MAFNPDAYLKQPADQQGFDPDAYLSDDQAAPVGFDAVKGATDPQDIKAGEILNMLQSGEITEAEALVRATAAGGDRLIADAVGMLPESVRDAASWAASKFMETLPGEWLAYESEALEKDKEMLREFNPRAFDNIAASVNVIENIVAPVVGPVAGANLALKGRKAMGEMVKSDSTDGTLAEYRTNAAGLAVKDKNAIALMNNGVSPGVVRVLQISSRPVGKPAYLTKPDEFWKQQKATPQQPVQKGLAGAMQPPKPPKPPALVVAGGGRNTQSKLMEMTQIKKRGMTDEVYKIDHKASNVVGDSVKERFDYVLNKNKEAAGKLRVAANGLKNKEVDVSNALEGFRRDMMDMDIVKNLETGELDFSKSAVRFNPTAKKLINQVTNELMPIVERGGMANAYEMHTLKQAIDDLVSYGKNAEGLQGTTETVLKNLRKNIDTELDNKFGFYNAVNQQYADTVGKISDFQKLVGNKVDLTAKTASSDIGRAMRALTSNTQNRGVARNLIIDLEETAKKYGAKFNDEILPQVMYANELDRVFGVDTPTSIGGIMETAGAKATETALGLAGTAATGDGFAMARQVAAMTGKRPKSIHKKNLELFDLLEKTIKGEK